MRRAAMAEHAEAAQAVATWQAAVELAAVKMAAVVVAAVAGRVLAVGQVVVAPTHTHTFPGVELTLAWHSVVADQFGSGASAYNHKVLLHLVRHPV